MCGEGGTPYAIPQVLQPAHILLDSPPPPLSLSLSLPPPSLSIIIDPRVNATFQYTFVDCTAVVGGCTYRYYVLLRAGDMYALALDQEVEGKYTCITHIVCIIQTLYALYRCKIIEG